MSNPQVPNAAKPGAVSPANQAAGNSPAASKDMPAATKAAVVAQKKRKPMSVPVRRLEAEPIPGYHQHWIREANLPAAKDAGYDFVRMGESQVNTRNVGVDSAAGQSNDLSDRIVVNHGGDTLYLMKLPEEYFNEDMAKLAEANSDIWQQIFRGEQIAGQKAVNPGDASHRYLKEASISDSGRQINPHDRRNQPLMQRSYK